MTWCFSWVNNRIRKEYRWLNSALYTPCQKTNGLIMLYRKFLSSTSISDPRVIDFIIPNLTYKVTSSGANFPSPSMWKIAYGQCTMKTKEKEVLFKPQFYHASTFLLSWGRCTFDSYFLSLPQHPICTTHQLGTQSKQKQQQELAAIHYNRIKTFLGTSAMPSYHPWRPATTLLFPPITDTIAESGPTSAWSATFLKITAFGSEATSQNCRRKWNWGSRKARKLPGQQHRPMFALYSNQVNISSSL